MTEKTETLDGHVAFIQFAKRPIPGLVKTRLIPELGEEVATQVHETLLKRTLHTLVDSGLGAVQLWWDKAWDDKAYLAQLGVDGVFSTFSQEGDDLGERMYQALSTQLKTFRKVILLGSDCPVLSASYLAQAILALDSADLVLGPSDDGGYVLIGAKSLTYATLKDTLWGTPSVMATTLQQAQWEGLRTQLLPELWDVDLPEDYRRWKMME
ncbi:hypothetical protein BTA51_08220 [Hahella sp. CCB-MM4]|uniref:TIGR04282 family arsenosugar biosynthesis glycosyltransferase n=1 Tax=Hahella sp. (strain CCB-MM4) TaxID=1926491 RepID=UPI000BD4F581|nr:TIGR04282 family arsenosugar biosynthesis glycosyltransferase [Hahella sp. CCB-MM4]OZG74084.1 hypothetical protein BTA51_08220 [Hahella sp. CCB-MM4]